MAKTTRLYLSLFAHIYMVNKEDSINIRFILVKEPVNFSADLGFLLNHYL